MRQYSYVILFIACWVLIFLACLVCAGCSVVRIQYGEATVTSVRLFEDQNLEGLEVVAPDGTAVKLGKKSNDAASLEELGGLIGTAAGAMAKKAATP